MPARVASPVISEPGVDISGTLTSSTQDGRERIRKQSTDDDELDRNDPGAIADIIDPESSDDGDEAFIATHQASSNRKASSSKTKSSKKSGGFQSMGLNAGLLKAITRKGFSVPTPIQRKTIPTILDDQDVVGMARTGSGKTAAFVIPMIEKLKTHSVQVGARALILAPSRELALQTLKAVKEFSRGTDLRTVLIVGGDGLDEQFSQMASNPDIIIATPGRFLHIMVEMSLDLSSVRYAVFDEADRLFEMGFATQLHEILHAIPASRQTMLFSATLPKSLVEFAKAGLKDPALIRLDIETKISPDLRSTFLMVKSAEKEGALLHIVHDLIRIPPGEIQNPRDPPNPKKRKRFTAATNPTESPTAFSTIVFAATKHHVEYLTQVLRQAGYAVSYSYGSLDQTARKMHAESFRNGYTSILVVTDVAARGIDIPILANVINYDFPPHPKAFVHRVGRTARAAKQGWSYNMVQPSDIPYVLDLQLFLGRALVAGQKPSKTPSFAEDVVMGSIPHTKLETSVEWATKLLEDSEELQNQKLVASKGEKLYMRTRKSASTESVKRAGSLSKDQKLQEANAIYDDGIDSTSVQRDQMLARIGGFRPQETVFELGRHANTSESGNVVRRQREKIESKRRDHTIVQQPTLSDHDGELMSDAQQGSDSFDHESQSERSSYHEHEESEDSLSDDDELDIVQPSSDTHLNGKNTESWQDSEHFISYQPRETNTIEDRGYGVKSGSSDQSTFVEAARGVTMDLGADQSRGYAEASRPRPMQWDKRSRKYVSKGGEAEGSQRSNSIVGESGQRLAASFRSGRFSAWRKSNKISGMPRVGENEDPRLSRGSASAGKKYKHNATRAPKQPDKYRDDYHTRKKRLEEAKTKDADAQPQRRRVKNELNDAEGIRKQRLLKQQRKDKNARPSRNGKRGSSR
ncbi:MAG: ATP-dependent RNA helicase dbp10 [Alyxoria varia]|nr:MAG: ATP-dependent RNA helicase dbp10 [Alyxoria varia]